VLCTVKLGTAARRFYARLLIALFLLFAERPDSPLHIFKSPSFARIECSVSGQDFP
jgi:hypothetical protein